MIFDNRTRDLPDGVKPGLHLGFRIRGKRILYCYIRKNACSSFKRLIMARSRERARLAEFPSRIRFLQKIHGVRPVRTEGFDHSVFVIRDPAERLVSVFRNKFIQRNGNVKAFRSHASLTGQDPETVSFAGFMENYMRLDPVTLDPHLRPQAFDLAPVVYSDAIELENLHTHMTALMGDRPADRYFLQKINSSTSPATGPQPDLPAAEMRTTPAETLHRRWKETGRMPATADFLDPGIREQIRDIYAEDYRILDAVRQTPAPALAGAAS